MVSKRRPWKAGKERLVVAKAFAVTSMPFVLLKATPGTVSLLTDQLSIPPAAGAGTFVDLAVLATGLVVVALWTEKQGEENSRPHGRRGGARRRLDEEREPEEGAGCDERHCIDSDAG